MMYSKAAQLPSGRGGGGVAGMSPQELAQVGHGATGSIEAMGVDSRQLQARQGSAGLGCSPVVQQGFQKIGCIPVSTVALGHLGPCDQAGLRFTIGRGLGPISDVVGAEPASTPGRRSRLARHNRVDRRRHAASS